MMRWRFWSRGGRDVRPTNRRKAREHWRPRCEVLEDRVTPAGIFVFSCPNEPLLAESASQVVDVSADLATRAASTGSAPGALLSIGGTFNPTATTFVVFKDTEGYKVKVLATSVTRRAVEVGVPLYFDPETLEIGSGTVTVKVIQQTPLGTSRITAFPEFQIGDLPETGLAPGTVVSDFLGLMQDLTGEAITNFEASIQEAQGQLSLEPLLTHLENLDQQYAELEQSLLPVINGQVQQANLGEIGGADLIIDQETLALADRILAAYLGASGPAIHGSLSAGTRQEITIPDLNQQLRDFLEEKRRFEQDALARAQDAIESVVNPISGMVDRIGGSAAKVGNALTLNATELLPAFLGVVLDNQSRIVGADDLVGEDKARETKSFLDFVKPFLKRIKDEAVDLLGLSSEESYFSNVVDATKALRQDLNRQNANSTAAGLINFLKDETPSETTNLQGTWSGTMTYTVPGLGTQTATLSMTFNPGANGTSFSGSATISNSYGSDTGSHSSTGSGDPISQVSGQIFDSFGDPNFTYQGQINGDTITGTMTDAVGVWTNITFTLTKT